MSTRKTPKHKIVFVGDQGVGKSCLAGRFIYDIYEEKYQPTIGIDFMTRTVLLDEFEVRLQVWDTAGQERFRCLIYSYIRDSEAALIVFDVTDYASFTSLREWIKLVRDERGDDVIIVIIGNKIDETEKRKVSYEAASSLAERLGFTYIETSAKTGYNVKLLFTKLSKDLFVRHYAKYLATQEEAAKSEDIVIFDKQIDKQNKITIPKCNC